MQIRRLFRYALVPALALGITLHDASTAVADDEEEATSRRVRIRIAKPKSLQTEGGSQAQKNPADAILRWAMKEMGPSAGEGHGADTLKMLSQWFDGDDDIPMSGLRDELKTDGWDASSLIRWMHREGAQMAAMAPMVMQMLGQQGGATFLQGPTGFGTAQGQGTRGPWMRGRGMQGHGMSRWGGHAQSGCPQCHQMGRGQGMHRGGMRRWGMRRRHLGMGRRSGRNTHHGAMGHAPQHLQGSRTIILWNDGSGWHRQELPSGAPQGHMRSGHMHSGHGIPGWMEQMLQGEHPNPRSQHHMGVFVTPGGPEMHGHGMRGHGMRGRHVPSPQPGHAHPAPQRGGAPIFKRMLKGLGRKAPDMSSESLQQMIDDLKKQVLELEKRQAAGAQGPATGHLAEALQQVEKMLKELGESGSAAGIAPERMDLEAFQKLLKGLDTGTPQGAIPGRKIHIRLVKPKDIGDEIEVIQEEVIKEDEKGK